jgi:hypothetical protein
VIRVVQNGELLARQFATNGRLFVYYTTWRIRTRSTVAKRGALPSPTSFGEGNDGALYLVSQGGTLYRFAVAELPRTGLYESLTRSARFPDAATRDWVQHAPVVARGVDG